MISVRRRYRNQAASQSSRRPTLAFPAFPQCNPGPTTIQRTGEHACAPGTSLEK